jgi:hypothetical protein
MKGLRGMIIIKIMKGGSNESYENDESHDK